MKESRGLLRLFRKGVSVVIVPFINSFVVYSLKLGHKVKIYSSPQIMRLIIKLQQKGFKERG